MAVKKKKTTLGKDPVTGEIVADSAEALKK